MITLSFAPFNLWWIAFLCFPISFYLIYQSQYSTFLLGFAFGLGYFGSGISWVHVSIADFGGLPLIGSLGLMGLLCGYLALFPAISLHIAKRYFTIRHWPAVLPLIWLFSEWVRANLFTGFPWLSIGYSQLYGPLSGLFPLIGEIGVTCIFIALCASISLALFGTLSNKIYGGLFFLIIVNISWISNSTDWVKKTGELSTISMIQGNIPQTLRWVPEQDIPIMQKYLSMTQSHWDSDVIIWPEAAIPQLEPIAAEFLDLLDRQATENNSALVTGIVNYQFETDIIHNNLIAIGLDTETENTIPYRYMHNNRFAKHHLLPIGEFVPFESILRNLAPIFDLPMSSFTRGDYIQANLKAKNIKLAPAICFEIAFPNQILANLTEQTNAIITVSNDAWFGDSHGPHQHLQIAQVRARELGLPVLRATNNGVTAFINEKGHLEKVAPQFEATTLTHAVEMVQGKTPYRLYGNTPIWLIFIGINMIIYLIRMKRVM